MLETFTDLKNLLLFNELFLRGGNMKQSMIIVFLFLLALGGCNGATQKASAAPSFNQPDLSDVRVISILFFESGYDIVQPSERKYREIFDSKTARYINWEWQFDWNDSKYKDDAVHFVMHYKILREDGSIKGQGRKDCVKNKEWKNSMMAYAWGDRKPGSWESGVYRVQLYYGGTKIAEEKFTVR